ncbi:hypothetical protein DPMN_187476 [Dreissena polymorpha]|uniref:BPTI/Kunitz inhibitor domain-containing protein n=1 Tax=Dreissena polymorpha TaxID=45954 RepID=A0A9D4DQM8_DREPO|nr:hypothetical protein DPMN_187476 [Dreissena polymorpha]
MVLCVTAIPVSCLLPRDVHYCLPYPIHQYFFNSTSMSCEMFHWGGCSGLGRAQNRFPSMEACLAGCACALEVDPGPCYASIPMWYHHDGVCRKFVYGGCLGNANRFKTEKMCKLICKA